MLKRVPGRSSAWLRHLTAAAVAVCAACANLTVARAQRPIQPPPQTFTSQSLPPGVVLDADDPALVAIVTTDLDTDGDLDIVATDSDLRLYVWINDGAGHFTRQEPARLPTWRGDPSRPRVNDGAALVELVTQTSRPSVDRFIDAASESPAASVAPALPPPDALVNANRAASTPRAPPAAIPLD
jgi:hypothetical protein